MLKKIGISLLCAAASLSATVAYATVNNALQRGVTVEYELLPNEAQMFTNYLFWAVEANCRIATEDDSNDLLVNAVARKGAVNGIIISAGDTVHVTVHAGEMLKLRAESGAKVEITNLGKHVVKAVCTA